MKGSIYYRYLLEGTLKKEREKLGIRGNISGGYNVSRLQRKFEFINFGKDNLFFQLTLRVFEMFISWMFTITRIPPFWLFRGSFPINQRK